MFGAFESAAAGATTLGFIQNLGWMEILIILIVALLLFGRRLPEVGRNLGKGIVEFKKGLKNVEEEIEQQSSPRPSTFQQTQALPRGEAGGGSLPAPGGEASNVDQRVSRADQVP